MGITSSGETFTLAEFVGTGWSLMNSDWSLHSCKNSSGDDHIFELVGNKMVCQPYYIERSFGSYMQNDVRDFFFFWSQTNDVMLSYAKQKPKMILARFRS